VTDLRINVLAVRHAGECTNSVVAVIARSAKRDAAISIKRVAFRIR
jgi:hypothetical protein